MKTTITIDRDASDIPSDEVLNDESHKLGASVDKDNGDIYLEFSSREAMRDFALSLLHESIYGAGDIEMYPLGFEGKWQVVSGVRLTESSSRIFINLPDDKHT
ncbi:hypothetical protein [Neptuniibacter sp. QD37_11]|uniref:hypothetical protein n=1 Tax=Neptuniibacter sp. QD37_11 TaxID=3398209 RepID=UPI0039F44922